MQFEVANSFSLQASPHFSESWLQERIAEDPAILGLGSDVELLDYERAQPRAGRLDLLLHDAQLNRRYEVELMLGPTDPSHIVRTIEYWDIERRRYPAYDHVAVLVAEDITARFLNVMGLMAGSIPLIAIQAAALKVDKKVLLHFVQILNQADLRTDDAYEEGASASRASDRQAWEAKVGGEALALCDALVGIANEREERQLVLQYKKVGISVAPPGAFFNAFVLYPKKQFVSLSLRLDDLAKWVERCDEVGLDARIQRAKRLVVRLRTSDLADNIDQLRNLIHCAVDQNLQNSTANP